MSEANVILLRHKRIWAAIDDIRNKSKVCCASLYLSAQIFLCIYKE